MKLVKLYMKHGKVGAKFDSWDELFNYEIWQVAIKKVGLDITKLIYKDIDLEEKLPWDNISVGVTKDFLKKEYLKGIIEEKQTKNCMEKCSNCGITKKYECKLAKISKI